MAKSLLSCTTAFLFLQLPTAGNGKADFHVQGPRHLILAFVGELPCGLVPNISAKGMELRWYRDQPQPAVLVHRNGEDLHEEQMAEYRGRTTFVSSGVPSGEAAVRIHRVTVLDNGTYHCLFKEGTSSNEATLWLKVAGLGSEPRIRVVDSPHKGFQAACTSAGWYPQPVVEWRDFRGQPVSAVTSFSASATTGLLAVVSSVTLQNRAVEGLSCSISNPLLPERKSAKSQLPAPLSRPLVTEWRRALALALIVLALLTAGVVCLFKKYQREEQQALLREETAQAEKTLRAQTRRAKAEPLLVSPSLDPENVSPEVTVSEDQKSVMRQLISQHLPPSSERFNQEPCVLAQERFRAGKYYWEVEPLQRLGVFLDCDAGEISFHNAIDGSLIYRFSALSFSVPLQPFFCLWTHDPSPLTICPVARETQEDTSPSGSLCCPPGDSQDFC